MDSPWHPVNVGLHALDVRMSVGDAGEVWKEGGLLHLKRDELKNEVYKHMVVNAGRKPSESFWFERTLGKGGYARVVKVGERQRYNREFAVKMVDLSLEDTHDDDKFLNLKGGVDGSIREVLVLK